MGETRLARLPGFEETVEVLDWLVVVPEGGVSARSTVALGSDQNEISA